MDENEIAKLSATILAGVIAGERASADEKTLRRAVDLAFRLKAIITEKQATATLTAEPPVPKPPAA